MNTLINKQFGKVAAKIIIIYLSHSSNRKRGRDSDRAKLGKDLKVCLCQGPSSRHIAHQLP